LSKLFTKLKSIFGEWGDRREGVE